MKDAGVNTVRVYTVDASLNHDGCMQAFASQGIYVWIDLADPKNSINRATPEWTQDLFDHMSKVVDTFALYNNTLAMAVANEVISFDNETQAAGPYIKAAARDMKAFRNARGYRKIPVAYSAADIVSIQQSTADYLACGDEVDSIEMYGLNAYSWCGNSSYSEAGYDKLYERLQPLNIPAIFSEVGCNVIQPRTFDEVSVILGSVFPNAFSGAIVYEWAQEQNDYGLVEYPSNSTGGFPSPLPDYSNLQKVLSTAKPVSTPRAEYTPSNSAPACPTTDDDWILDGDVTLPTIAGLNIKTVSAKTTYVNAAAAESTGAETTAVTGTSAGAAAGSTSSSDESGGGGAASSDSQGLSTGAMAGIAVGGAFAGILAIAAGFFILRRRKAARAARGGGAQNSSSAYQANDSGHVKPELAGVSVAQVRPKQEMDASETRRGFAGWKSRNSVPTELDARQRISRAYEVEGSIPNEYYGKGSNLGSSDQTSSSG
jgi:1,3-beta-glucanosyltransferase GAS1